MKKLKFSWLEKYDKIMKKTKLKMDAKIWISLIFVISITAMTAGLLFSTTLGILLFIVILDLGLGYPYFKYQSRIADIEDNLPDALKQMADTLKAGGTYEYALREVSASDFGALTTEVNYALRRLEEGENFENSLKSLSENIDSRLIRRTVTIIVDSIKSGAGLADVLEEVAEDIRDAHRIIQERKSKTLMQVLFMVAAGAVVAPFILGMVSSIIDMLINKSIELGVAAKEELVEAIKTKDLISLLMESYLFIEIIASSIMISLMRDGKFSKSVMYLPILLFIAYIIYLVGKVMVGSVVGGVSTGGIMP
ncbi:MAG: type II secretion system F family protein [archaeon]